jgi:hypothetical protein
MVAHYRNECGYWIQRSAHMNQPPLVNLCANLLLCLLTWKEITMLRHMEEGFSKSRYEALGIPCGFCLLGWDTIGSGGQVPISQRSIFFLCCDLKCRHCSPEMGNCMGPCCILIFMYISSLLFYHQLALYRILKSILWFEECHLPGCYVVRLL